MKTVMLYFLRIILSYVTIEMNNFKFKSNSDYSVTLPWRLHRRGDSGYAIGVLI